MANTRTQRRENELPYIPFGPCLLYTSWAVVKAADCENAKLIMDTWHWVRANQPDVYKRQGGKKQPYCLWSGSTSDLL